MVLLYFTDILYLANTNHSTIQYGEYHDLQKGTAYSFSKKYISEANALLDVNVSFDFTKKVDIVYTWVNGTDPEWIKNYQCFIKKERIKIESNAFSIRFIEGEELRYSLRSIEKYAIHFVRYIYIIVANKKTQVPCWLNTLHPKIRIITHQMIFGDLIPPESQNDPNLIFNFNSLAIENCILNIPDLSNKFIYFNDDFFLGQKVQFDDFFNKFNKPKIYVNFRNYDNSENEYESYKKQAINDYAGSKFHAEVTYTVSTFKRKYGNATNLEQLHVAYPITKNILQETREIFNESISNTILSPFRKVDNILIQYLTFQYGIKFNLVQPIPNNDTEIAFIYGNILYFIKQFSQIYQNKIKLFGINIDIPSQTSKVKAFLNLIFPDKSSFELDNSSIPYIIKMDEEFWKLNLNITNNSY